MDVINNNYIRNLKCSPVMLVSGISLYNSEGKKEPISRNLVEKIILKVQRMIH